ALDVRSVDIANLHERRDTIVDRDNLEGEAVVVIATDNLRADADRVLRQAHALRDVLLEHESEAPSLLESVDLRLEVSTQGWVLNLVQENVQLASDHSLRLSAGVPT